MRNRLLLIYFLISSCASAQEILVYHGTKGTSTLLIGSSTKGAMWANKARIGDEVRIKIINAHPALYEYSFVSEEVAIEDPDFPNFPQLLSSISTELGLETKQASAGRAGIAGSTTWPDTYKMKVDEFKRWIINAEDIIAKSDFPETIDQALVNSSAAGFLYAKKELALNDIFKIPDIDKFISDFQSDIKGDGRSQAPHFYNERDNTEKILMELYDNYFKTISLRAKEIKNAYQPSVSASVTYTFKMSDKKRIIKLVVKSKNEKLKSREVGDSVIRMTIIPLFDRPLLELIPVALLSESSNGKKFGINNGMISAAPDSKFQFGTGALLNLNFAHWGQRKEFSAGIGVGFALVDENMNSFFLGSTMSFGKWVRLGVGYGWLRTPTGLKNGLQVGSSAVNINDINDIVDYTRERALFFTLVLPGLSLPVLK